MANVGLRGPTAGQLVDHLVGKDCRHCEAGTNERAEHKGYVVARCDGCEWIAAKEFPDE